MNKPKFFDKYMIIFTVISGVGFFVSTISNALATIYVAENMTSDEFGNPIIPDIPYIYSAIYTLSLMILIIGVVWFIVRSITYKSRVKEYLLENNQNNSCTNN